MDSGLRGNDNAAGLRFDLKARRFPVGARLALDKFRNLIY